jgi:uncharacterized repeat protein (TIGR01451 family)
MDKLKSALALALIMLTVVVATGLMIQTPPLALGSPTGFLNAPAGFTETPTDVPTSTPTDTPVPTSTDVPTPTPTDTPVPTFTLTPTSTPTSTPPPTSTDAPPPLPPAEPTATPELALAEPRIIKRVNLEQGQVGDVVVFTIEIINPNPVSIGNVVVGDALSPLADYLGASVPRGTFNYDPNTHAWTLLLDAMGPNEQLAFTITVRINERARSPNALLNTAVLTSSHGVTQSNTTQTLIVPKHLPGTGRR